MVKVIRTEKNGNERVMSLDNAAWDRLVKRPNLVSGVKWRLWTPQYSQTKFIEVPIDAEIIIKKHETPKEEPKAAPKEELKTPVKEEVHEMHAYGEKEYQHDYTLAKKFAKEGKNDEAKVLFQRALKFKPKNPYIKGQLKKL